MESDLNRLVGGDREKILSASRAFLHDGTPRVDTTAYGDAHGAARIVNMLIKEIAVEVTG